VVEDEAAVREAVVTGLRHEGFVVRGYSDAVDGGTILGFVPDLAILDVRLPSGSGFALARRLRERSGVSIIFLTARDAVADRVEGLELGADDYLPKPFEFAELVARVRALGRRPGAAVPPKLKRGDLALDSARRVAFRGDRRLTLSPKEFALLEYLMAADGRVISAEELLARVWDEAADPFTSTVKTTIGRLRAKLGEPSVIETVREAGYRI
jgi:DNA-binding response OmpR family regulator